MAIEFVFFDLDGTLLDRRATFRRHLELQIERHPHLFDGAAPHRYMDELLVLDENGMLDRDEFYRQVESRYAMRTGAGAELRADFEANFPESCVPFPGLEDTLAALRRADIRLGLITNGRVLIQSRKIDRLGIRHLFDAVVISEAANVRKPDPRIFSAALAELSASPPRTAYVGDNPDADITGAKQSGLVAIWKRDDFWTAPEHADAVIESLSDLPRLIEGIV